jgi:hypothetical protein
MRRQAQVDAIVVDELLRRLRLRMAAEIGGRANHRHAHIRADANGNHVLCHLLPATHAGVVSLSHDIGQPVIDDDLDLDIGVFPQKRRKFWRQDRFRLSGGSAGRQNSHENERNAVL